MKGYETAKTSVLVSAIISAGFFLAACLGWNRDVISSAALFLAAEFLILAVVLAAVSWLIRSFGRRAMEVAESEGKEREWQIRRLIQIDEMTGMLTKMATGRQIDQILRECGQEQYAFFIFDIDNFKQANDRFGHAFGDDIIKDFTATIRGQFRQGDVLGRIGGDEFVAFVCAGDREWVEKKAGQLVGALCKPYRQGEKEWMLSASIGVFIAPGSGSDYNSFYRNADKALYKTKRNGKNGFTIHEDE